MKSLWKELVKLLLSHGRMTLHNVALNIHFLSAFDHSLQGFFQSRFRFDACYTWSTSPQHARMKINTPRLSESKM